MKVTLPLQEDLSDRDRETLKKLVQMHSTSRETGTVHEAPPVPATCSEEQMGQSQ